ncbi:MAG: sensor histidine kinase [Bacteroidetes bacterium]|nr:sensor histidine kinase [Bacteroidota bacterium]
MEEPNPRILAILAALTASIIVVISEILISSSSYIRREWLAQTMVFLVAFVVTYIIFKYLLEVFIYRKIKLIYKTITTSKNSKEKALEKIDLDVDILANVSKEVMEWDQNRSDEIAELKRMENFRKEFLGNVSHELKTPLFNIQGYIHTLLEGALDDPEVNVNYLQRASRSVDRLCLIVDDLEAISKMESGEMMLDQRTFDIHELTKDVFESSELKAKEMEISLSFKEGSDRQFYVYGDKDRIRQVLVNLMINSIKYGKKGGSTVVGFYDMDQNILVEVTDTGIGIDTKYLPRLFERFFRVDKSRSREQGGTGLGLSIVKHIIEAHHQTINVRSTLGVGTTFTFTLRKAR